MSPILHSTDQFTEKFQNLKMTMIKKTLFTFESRTFNLGLSIILSLRPKPFSFYSTMVLKDSCKLRTCGQNDKRGVDCEENVKSETTLLLFIFNSLLFKDVY